MKLIEIAFFTRNVKGVAEFYEKFLGVEPASRSEEAVHFELGEVKILVHVDGQPPQPGWPANVDHTAFGVEDVDRACDELEARGLKVEFGPRDYPWGRSAYLNDPDGRLIEVHKPQAKHQ